MSQDFGAGIFVLLLILIWNVSDNGLIATFKADEFTCKKWDDSKFGASRCLKRVIEGQYRISLNKATGGCAVLFRNQETGFQRIEAGSSMSFIDSDNWECKTQPVVGFQQIYNMGDGKISSYTFDTVGAVLPKTYDVARSDGIWGSLSHYWHLAMDWARKN